MKYILQSKILDGRFDGVADQYVSDGSGCRQKEVDGTEIGFPGGGWPSGGVDMYHKNKGEWWSETLPLPLDAVIKKLELRIGSCPQSMQAIIDGVKCNDNRAVFMNPNITYRIKLNDDN